MLKIQKNKIVAIVFALLAIVMPSQVYAQAAQVDSVESIGKAENPSRTTLTRDGGASGIVNGGVLWTFADTIFSPASVGGKSDYSSTAARASISNFAVLNEPLDANNAPSEFIPLTTSDENYNTTSGAGDDRYAYWPYQVAPINGGISALVYYRRLKVDPGYLNYTFLNTGVATVTGSGTTAARTQENLFSPLSPEPLLFQNPGFSKDGYIYVMDCKTSGCAIARVQEAGALTAANYRFWNGSDWVTNRASSVHTLPFGSNVGWNDYLQKYVMVSSTFLQRDVYIRTSDSLTSGWSQPQTVFTAPDYIYATRYQSHLDQNNGQSMIFSYYQPQNITAKGMQLLRVNLTNTDFSAEPIDVPGVPDTGSRDSVLWYWLLFALTAIGVTVLMAIKRFKKYN